MAPNKARRKGLFAIVLSLLLFPSITRAETPYDVTLCVSGAVTMISADKALTAFSAEAKGILRSNHENKIFDNSTSYGSGVVLIIDGKKQGSAITRSWTLKETFLSRNMTWGMRRSRTESWVGPASGKGSPGEARPSLLPKESPYPRAPCKAAPRSPEPMN